MSLLLILCVFFSVQFILARDLAVTKAVEGWPGLGAWVEECEGMSSWGRAIETAGYTIQAPFAFG
jgi:hypothetical protein